MRTTVPTDVVVGMEVSFAVPDDEDALTTHVHEEAVADVVDALGPTGVEPLPVEDPVAVQPVDLRRAVVLTRQRRRHRDGHCTPLVSGMSSDARG